MVGILKKEREEYIWLGQRSLDCIGLHELIDFKIILSCDYGLETEEISSRTGAQVVSIEKKTYLRENWSNQDVNRLFTEEMIKEVSAALSNVSKPVIVAYCSTPALEKIVDKERRIKLLSIPTRLKNILDNKISFRKFLPSLGVEPIQAKIVDLSSISYMDVASLYPSPFVIQMPYGASGNSSYLISNHIEFQDLKEKKTKTKVIVSELIRGLSPNVNAVVLDNEVLVSRPSVQLIGIQECSRNPFTYCGNDFYATENLPQSIINSIYEQTKKIGNHLRNLGYKGIFGVDFIISSGKVFPLEINPRFQGSTQLLTDVQINKKQIPLAYYHILGFLRGPNSLSSIDEMFFDPIKASQIVIHNRNGSNCKVLGEIRPGVYQIINSQLVYMRPGISLSDCLGEKEFVITCAVPRTGTVVQPNAPLLKLHLPFPVLDTNTNRLTKEASSIVILIYSLLKLVDL